MFFKKRVVGKNEKIVNSIIKLPPIKQTEEKLTMVARAMHKVSSISM